MQRAAQRRQKVATGVSPGIRAGKCLSPEGATENARLLNFCRRLRRLYKVMNRIPGLTPGATFCRRCAACGIPSSTYKAPSPKLQKQILLITEEGKVNQTTGDTPWPKFGSLNPGRVSRSQVFPAPTGRSPKSQQHAVIHQLESSLAEQSEASLHELKL